MCAKPTIDAVPTFTLDGQRLAYTVHGTGPRVTVLLHGLLFSQRMHSQLAEALAGRGNRVVTLDLLGHGASDRPLELWRRVLRRQKSDLALFSTWLENPELN